MIPQHRPIYTCETLDKKSDHPAHSTITITSESLWRLWACRAFSMGPRQAVRMPQTLESSKYSPIIGGPPCALSRVFDHPKIQPHRGCTLHPFEGVRPHLPRPRGGTSQYGKSESLWRLGVPSIQHGSSAGCTRRGGTTRYGKSESLWRLGVPSIQ